MNLKEAAEIYLDVATGTSRNINDFNKASKVVLNAYMDTVTVTEMAAWCRGYLSRSEEDEA